MARIENHKYSIEEAFRECFYIVPDYQREYVWTDKEVHLLSEAEWQGARHDDEEPEEDTYDRFIRNGQYPVR